MSTHNIPKFITEDYLKQYFGMRQGGEIQLAPGTRFTPAAQQMLNERKITVRWRDEKGQVFVEKVSANQGIPEFEQVHPLKNNNIRPKNSCMLCHSDVTEKPALMTHLNDTILVPKSHPRILLRGKLDACISYCVLVQCEMNEQPEILKCFMADIRSYLGQILQSEVMGQPLPTLSLGDFDEAMVHQWSHNPLKHLGHDHMLPDVSYGKLVSQLNYLRAQVRELELSAISVFLDHSMQLTSDGVDREDIVAGLNRLSSAVYVVMILVWLHLNGHELLLKGLSNEVT
ncbi:ethanolamine utilization cob(I)yrinic acid a,c-diamide adenosyltransferase EutT [Photobacterium carnosum]|uniref:ethanolamine utilization cob(I)yrinic acid a,c-diamide adenosyltransferase EutT n=1 Tax=Photobacterium carnosum TaxID=2023717 RepID=UPI001E2B5B0A|nr:ethanolamine utilization cob(I)yrinic acid a,c-diamide adenosyltransferase EutT [Photobacterium carnosum]MCD9522967.1 ethanolamine utilization cob(I)yrinic acid a,c-diamide adenosyltransferase EutT [Photobacterium carnosum]